MKAASNVEALDRPYVLVVMGQVIIRKLVAAVMEMVGIIGLFAYIVVVMDIPRMMFLDLEDRIASIAVEQVMKKIIVNGVEGPDMKQKLVIFMPPLDKAHIWLDAQYVRGVER